MLYHELPYPEQKRTIVRDLNRFVNHCDMVYKHSAYKAHTTARVLDKINLVKNRVIEINTFLDLYTICVRMVGLKKALAEILPHPLNNSYESSIATLTEMQSFALDYVNSKNQHQISQIRPVPANQLVSSLRQAAVDS